MTEYLGIYVISVIYVGCVWFILTTFSPPSSGKIPASVVALVVASIIIPPIFVFIMLFVISAQVYGLFNK